jgi:hypothetical protein
MPGPFLLRRHLPSAVQGGPGALHAKGEVAMPKRPCRELQTRLVAVGLLALYSVLLLVGPVRAHVAGKTYDLWMANTPGQPPSLHTCARFTATTLQVDACGPVPGEFEEFVLVNEPPNFITEWFVLIPCNGIDVVFVGTSTDGGALGFQANVMAASANSIAGQFVVSVAGVENPACQ